MKTLLTFLFLAGSTALSSAEALTQADREALLEKLLEIRENAQSKVDSRFATATNAFRSAMRSPDTALELYLNCVEKVNYEQANKKSSEFRDWKRKNSDRLKDETFARSLQQQLRWLNLTLEAASKDPDKDKLALKAAEILDSITSQAELFAPYHEEFNKAVTESVFASAYGIDSLKLRDWPLSPLPISKVYQEVILPTVRQPDRIISLKSAWQKRILQEGTIAEHWIKKEKGETPDPAAELLKFRSKTLPTLRWASEVDQYKAGDQQGAALRMLSLIETNLSHPEAQKWVNQFNDLLKVNPAP